MPGKTTKNEKQFILTWIENNKERFFSCADAVWDYAELGLEEYRSSQLLMQMLEEAGFAVEKGVAGMPTAFVARWGKGRPVIAFSCECDALPGLSQSRLHLNNDPVKKPLVEGAPGHGCGHNILGTGAVMAALATKAWLHKEKREGTLVVFGTPAEEICVGKPFMACEGLYAGIDAILDWHPSNKNVAGYDRMNAYFNIKYHFSGVTSHGNAPWLGRSALDSALLMAHALEMLREHVPPGVTTSINIDGANTINYTFSDCGPEFPNVVPDRATLWVVGRFNNSDQMKEVIARIHKCAEGAAIAAGTEWKMEFITATHEKIPNRTLAKILHENFQEIGIPQYDKEEQEFVKALQRQKECPETGNTVDLAPFGEGFFAVSDVSEYSWFAPFSTIEVNMLEGDIGWHNWQVTAVSRSSIGKKTMLHAVKVLATACIDLINDPRILDKARKELKERLMGREYETLIPLGIKPPLEINKLTMKKYRSAMEEVSKTDSCK